MVAVLLATPALLRADDPDRKPIAPAEAARHINEKCVVEMEVKSTGKSRDGNAVFLNSETDFKDKNNFTIFLGGKELLEKFKKAKIDDPAAHFKDRTIRVTGTVKLYREKPEIAVDDPDQIQVVEKK
jgi:DNA/RNA endonuclease YhcR with UshA esterase domain